MGFVAYFLLWDLIVGGTLHSKAVREQLITVGIYDNDVLLSFYSPASVECIALWGFLSQGR